MTPTKLPSKQTYVGITEIPSTYVKPDIFLMVTCNPNCQEIQDALLLGQTPQAKQDLVARVFGSKLKMMKEMLTKNYIPGVYVYVVEFQKRGLPRAHFMLM
jgi:hypothetical protein